MRDAEATLEEVQELLDYDFAADGATVEDVLNEVRKVIKRPKADRAEDEERFREQVAALGRPNTYVIDFSDSADHTHWAPLTRDKCHRVGRSLDEAECYIFDERNGEIAASWSTEDASAFSSFNSEDACQKWINDRGLGAWLFPWAHLRVSIPGQVTPDYSDKRVLK